MLFCSPLFWAPQSIVALPELWPESSSVAAWENGQELYQERLHSSIRHAVLRVRKEASSSASKPDTPLWSHFQASEKTSPFLMSLLAISLVSCPLIPDQLAVRSTHSTNVIPRWEDTTAFPLDEPEHTVHCAAGSVSAARKHTWSSRTWRDEVNPSKFLQEFELAEWTCSNSVLHVIWRQHLRSGILNPDIEFTFKKPHSISDPRYIAQMWKNSVGLDLHKAQATTEDIPDKAHSRKEEGCFVHICLEGLFFAIVRCTFILCRSP